MDIDKSKENIQPLRGGRNVLQLTTALQAQSDGDAQKQLILQKAEHEASIQNYVGPDPLDVWFTYIQWLEQSFPKHGHEGSIDKALKTCLTEFENDPRYTQDRRFVRLWIKYIDYHNNPLELYQLLYNKGVGSTCSELYRAWACYCEEATDYRKADQVYKLGLQANAQPIDELEQAHMNFQMWFAQRTLNNDSPTKRKAAYALAETRLALTSLRTVKRRNMAAVPSQRTGENIQSIIPGVVRQQQNSVNSQHRSNIMVDIHQDKAGPSSVAGPYIPQSQDGAAAPVQSILQSCAAEENQKEVGIWTNPSTKNGKLGTISKLPATQLSFTPYEDDTLVLSAKHVPFCREDFSDFIVPIWVPDPPDSTKIPQYNKKEVYKEGENGLKEFSLEEIRARKYITAYKSSIKYKNTLKAISEQYRDANGSSSPMESSSKLLHTNMSALQTLANCAIATENSDKYICNDQYAQSDQASGQNMESNREHIKLEYPLNDMPAVPVSSEFNLENIIAQSNSILNAEDPHQSVVLEQNEGYIVEYIDMSKPPQYDQAAKMDNIIIHETPAQYNNAVPGEVNYAPPKKSIYADFNRSLLANVQDDSMTVNTREANREIDNVFASPVLADESLAPVPIVPQFGDMNFQIHKDHSMTMAAVLGNHASKTRPENYTVQGDNNVEQGREFAGFMPRNTASAGGKLKVPNFDETCSTQMFDFNVAGSSTPYGNQADHFKKPYFLDYNKTPNVKKFNFMEDAETLETSENNEQNGLPSKPGKDNDVCATLPDTIPVDNNGLSPIMETTREHRSCSNSSGSYQTTRNTMFGYTARESCGPSLGVISEKSHQDSHTSHDSSNHQQVDPITFARRQPASGLAKMTTAHLNRNYNIVNDNKNQPVPIPQTSSHNLQPQLPQQYHTIDHQYHKTSNNYNGYAPQTNISQGYPNPGQQMVAATGNGMYQHQGVYQTAHVNYQIAGYQNSQHGQIPYLPGYPGHQQGMPSPQAGFQSPQHGLQSPQPGFTSPQRGFTSPQRGFTSPQQGFTSPQQGFTSPQHGYTSPQQGYASPHPSFQSSQHMYQNQSHQQVYMSPHNPQAGFQSPPHVVQGFSSPHQGFQSPPHTYQTAPSSHLLPNNSQQSYHQQPYHNQSNSALNRSQYVTQQPAEYNNVNHSQNYPANQSYALQNNSYQNQMKPQPMNTYNNYQNSQSQSPSYANYKNTQNSSINVHQQQGQQHYAANNSSTQHMQQEYPNNSQTAMNHSQYLQQQSAVSQASTNTTQNNQNQSYHAAPSQKSSFISSSISILPNTQQMHKPPYQSPTSKLRSVRHEVPHIAPKAAAPITSPAANPGFSNQFLNFISARNEPKDNANTPKFNNSPNISQKMHKNLYVSSPEQGQVPPTTDLNASEISKENSSVRTSMVSSKSSVYNQSIIDKQKDQSKRQLDFEHRTEIRSEDSRDSASKDSRMSSRQSVQSMNTDNYQMDVDSENSMDCQNITFKSNCSNILLTTQDIPKPAVIEFPKIIDPFKSELNNSLLQYVKFPNKNHIDGYIELKHVPKLQLSTVIVLGNFRYSVEKQLGKGTFGYVYRGFDLAANTPVALKYQKPGNPWEYYICKEIKARVSDPYMLCGYMDIYKACLGDNASIFVSELSKYGSLLDVTNKVKVATNKCINELIVMLMASEMLSIVHYLHKAEIIHADIKPDNFLLMKIPQTESRHPSLQLIDLGCAIDMSLYPEGTTFRKVISTEGFTCTEMREGRPWTYQTDLYCLAGTIFLVLMGKYMQAFDCGGQWNVEKKWPRYMKAVIWDKLFITLLNVKDCSNLPDLLLLKDMIDDHLRAEGSSALGACLNKLANVLKSR